jgi:hypothetical protein
VSAPLPVGVFGVENIVDIKVSNFQWEALDVSVEMGGNSLRNKHNKRVDTFV